MFRYTEYGNLNGFHRDTSVSMPSRCCHPADSPCLAITYQAHPRATTSYRSLKFGCRRNQSIHVSYSYVDSGGVTVQRHQLPAMQQWRLALVDPVPALPGMRAD